MFTEFLTEITKYQSDPSLSDFTSIIRRLMTMIIPFIIIVMLLTKAKKLAVKLSGDMGAIINKVGAVAGGLALGAATGGMAFAGKQTIGRVAANVSESEGLKNWAAKSKFGAGVLKTTRGIGSGSFDARGIKIGGKSLADAGLKNIGKAQTGGFIKERKDYSEKQEKFASSLEMSEKERYDKGLIYTGDIDKDKIIEATIKTINKERTLTRAKTVEGRGKFTSNVVAATKIREAGRNKSKKIQDAMAAIAAGDGVLPTTKTGGTPVGGTSSGTPSPAK